MDTTKTSMVSIVCDNCDGACTGYNEDPTMIRMAKEGDRPFRWGTDCTCANRRKREMEIYRLSR